MVCGCLGLLPAVPPGPGGGQARLCCVVVCVVAGPGPGPRLMYSLLLSTVIHPGRLGDSETDTGAGWNLSWELLDSVYQIKYSFENNDITNKHAPHNDNSWEVTLAKAQRWKKLTK